MNHKPTHEELRTKYLHLVKTKGYDHAITALHNNIGSLEPRVFDGGYSKERFEELQFMRDLARDLYTLKLAQSSQEYFK